MMENKFDLSRKAHFISFDDKDRNAYFEEDVKEFIDKLKDVIYSGMWANCSNGLDYPEMRGNIIDIINELAGDIKDE